MLIGIDTIGTNVFNQPSMSNYNISYMEAKNMIVDEIHLQNIIDNSDTKGIWTNGSVLLAKFNNDLEAGNVAMREVPITKLRIKRRNKNKTNYLTLKELPFNPDPTDLTFDDYTASSNRDYEYIVTPVDETGIEGLITAVSVTPEFEGWWLIDMDNPEENSFKFFYNLDDISINTDEDRSELRTFSKYPMVRYGQLRAKKGTLSGMLIPDDLDVRKQVEKLDNILQLHKSLLLKGNRGQSYIVDASSPTEIIQSKIIGGLSKIQINWVEVDAYND